MANLGKQVMVRTDSSFPNNAWISFRLQFNIKNTLSYERRVYAIQEIRILTQYFISYSLYHKSAALSLIFRVMLTFSLKDRNFDNQTAIIMLVFEMTFQKCNWSKTTVP